jgi:hypothetical protein
MRGNKNAGGAQCRGGKEGGGGGGQCSRRTTPEAEPVSKVEAASASAAAAASTEVEEANMIEASRTSALDCPCFQLKVERTSAAKGGDLRFSCLNDASCTGDENQQQLPRRFMDSKAELDFRW